ncbi:MAG: deaminase [Nitrososphaeria archaeon]|nr:deaminase [Nitrososphaeria archaeon]NIQ33317.1 deaminase [Nitrososphaeria archaeon]
MEKEIIKTDRAPALEPGGYPAACNAVKVGNLIFVSGQAGWTADKELVRGDAKAQTRQVIENIKVILEASGAALKDVVKVTVFLKNMDDFEDVCDVRNQYFGESPTASSAIEISRLVHDDLLVEIEAIAFIPENR